MKRDRSSELTDAIHQAAENLLEEYNDLRTEKESLEDELAAANETIRELETELLSRVETRMS